MAEVEVQIALFAGAWVKGTEIHVEPTQEEMMIRGKVARDAAKQTHATSSLQGDSLMKKLIVQLMFAMVVGVAVVSFSYAADLTESPILKTIEGDLLKIDGEFYVVKNPKTAECKISNKKDDGEHVLVGTASYQTAEEAKAAKNAAPECNEKIEK